MTWCVRKDKTKMVEKTTTESQNSEIADCPRTSSLIRGNEVLSVVTSYFFSFFCVWSDKTTEQLSTRIILTPTNLNTYAEAKIFFSHWHTKMYNLTFVLLRGQLSYQA